MDIDLSSLKNTVQTNCHIADAEHAGDYTLCVYLLRMREYYRWEMGLPFDARLPKDEVGQWLVDREALWENLGERPYEPLLLGDASYDPFEAEPINAILAPRGYVYSSGLGAGCRPHFFLGELLRAEEQEGCRVFVSGQELARDLSAPPAMALDGAVFIRRESLRRMIWEKIEEWSWRKSEGALQRALDHYDFHSSPDNALETMTDTEVDTVIAHELGEVNAGKLFGSEWHDMLAALPRSQAEFMARAVRDHLADCLSTLPHLLENERNASIHFYFGNLHAARKQLFPGLAQAYDTWIRDGDLDELYRVADRGRDHWQSVGEQMMELHRRHGTDCQPHIEELARNSQL